MAGSFASVAIRFTSDLSSFSSGIQNATREMDRAGKKMQNVGKAMSVAITAPLVALGATAVKNFDIQAKAIAQVEQGLKTTENQVGRTSKELQNLASELQNNSLFGDEAILKDVTAQLLTFTNIAGTQFERTQQAALDLATRLDGDLKSASIQLGKALNDPVANLSALSRSGIQFSEDQKKTINALVETNRLADAQTIILDELQKQYGGSAKAAAEAGTGAFKQLSNSIGDLTESFGGIIAEGLKPFVDRVKEIVQQIDKLTPETKKLIVVVSAFAAALGPVVLLAGTMVRNIAALIPLMTKLKVAVLANPYTALAVALSAVALAFGSYYLAAGDAVKITRNLNEVRKQAASIVAQERAELDTLVKAAQNDKLSKEQRLDAINKLNALSPEYLGNLNLESINTDKAATSIKNYVDQINKKALAQAAAAKKQELYAQLIEKQNEPLRAQVGFLQDSSDAFFELFGVETKYFNGVEDFNKKLQERIDKNEITEKQANNLRAAYKDLIDDRNADVSAIEKQISALDKYIDVTNAATASSEVLKESQNNKDPLSTEGGRRTVTTVNEINTISSANPLGEISSELSLSNDKIQEELSTAQANFLNFKIGFTQIVQDTAQQALAGFGELIAGLASGADGIGSIGSFILDTFGGLAIQVGKLAITIGAAVEGIKTALLSLNPVVAIAAGVALVAIGSLAKAQASQIASGTSNIPKFATGGFVPGNLTTGDRTLIRANAGELVLNAAQQNNLAGQLGGGGGTQVFIPKVKLSGSDLVIAFNRENDKNGRR